MWPYLKFGVPPADRAAAFGGALAPSQIPITAAGVEGTPGGENGLGVEATAHLQDETSRSHLHQRFSSSHHCLLEH